MYQVPETFVFSGYLSAYVMQQCFLRCGQQGMDADAPFNGVKASSVTIADIENEQCMKLKEN